MCKVLILDEDPADAIILREALLEVNGTLHVDTTRHADAALWRLMSSGLYHPEAGHEAPDLVVVGVRRTGCNGCTFVRDVLSRPGGRAPSLVVLAGSPCEESVRSRCVAGEYCRQAKPTRYDQYKALLREALGSLRDRPGPEEAPSRAEALCP